MKSPRTYLSSSTMERLNSLSLS
ncbi:hypothetical protein LUU34_00526500 [Aix galericulata]|nr:hypothetical protein LUU34_00526500 [Aix galericulata]